MAQRTRNNTNIEGVVTFTLLVEGDNVSNEIGVKSITVFNAANRIATADLIILDGDSAEQVFHISNSDEFVPGKKIEIQAGYNSFDETIFEGVITSQKVSVASSSTELHIQCKSAAYPMTLARKSNIYYDVTDSDVFEEIIGKYGITTEVATLNIQFNQLVQHRATDWDFIMSRAQINGFWCYEDNGSLFIEKPDINKGPNHTLIFGDNIYDLDIEMDARNQYKDYKVKTWNYSDQEIVEQEPEANDMDTAGDITTEALASENSEASLELIEGGSTTTELAIDWITAKKQWQELAKITGTIIIQGVHDLKPAGSITLEGVSERFNGDHLISAVSHEITDGNWKTHITIGVNPKWFAEQFDNVSELPASAMMPSISGLQIGLVTALEGDPAGEQRIQIQLPTVHAGSDGVWARVLSPYAGEGIGIQFLPEIGTEVLVGYLNDDPHQAVVLGGLFSNTNVAPQEFTDDNYIKTIVSKSEIKIEIDDEKSSIKIETPNGNLITADDDEGQIILEDENGNKMTMNSDGIEIDSPGDINIKASGDINIEGMNISNTANVEFKAEGSAGIEMSSGATAVLKGALVQIN